MNAGLPMLKGWQVARGLERAAQALWEKHIASLAAT
jgi:hypothetical protein